jgi:hypothetical protein
MDGMIDHSGVWCLAFGGNWFAKKRVRQNYHTVSVINYCNVER